MTSDMGDDFNEFRRMKKERNASIVAAFDATSWQALSDQHFRRVVGMARFDYWPSTGTVEWRGKYYRGIRPDAIEGFIRNRTDQ